MTPKGVKSKFHPKPSCFLYRSQVEPEVKEALHRAWLSGELQVIVATSAFGMGVHHSSVRHIFHWSLPESMSALSQVCGRRG
jgi:superfamily II DNA helicase RecQ